MITVDLTIVLVVAGLFAVGFFLMLQRVLMRVLLGFIVLGHGANLLLLLGAGDAEQPPITKAAGGGAQTGTLADPLPQAMALTAIVITFGTSAFLVALAYRSWRLSGHDAVRDDIEDRRISESRERLDVASIEKQ